MIDKSTLFNAQRWKKPLFVSYTCASIFPLQANKLKVLVKKYEQDLDVDSEEVMNLAGVVVGWSSLQ